MLDRVTTLITILTPLVASIAAILAWVAKIRWAKEYQQLNEKRVTDVEKNAAERITAAIASAEAQVAAADAKAAAAGSKAQAAQDLADFTEKRFRALTDFGPDEIKKYFEGVISLDKQKIAELEDLLEKANSEIQERMMEISSLKEEAFRNREVVDKTEQVLLQLKKEKSYLEENLREVEKRIKENDVVLRVIRRPEFDMEAVTNMLRYYESQKKWLLSSTRQAYEQRQAVRLASAEAVKTKLAEMEAEEEASACAQQSMKMDIDELKRKN